MKHFAGFAICPFLFFLLISSSTFGVFFKDDSLPVLVRFFGEDMFDKACWCRLAHWNDAEHEGQFVENMFFFGKKECEAGASHVSQRYCMENRENSGKNLRNPSRLQSQTIGFDGYEILAFGESPSCSVGDIVAKPRSYGWWKKSCTSWYGEYPIIHRVSYITGVSRISSINSSWWFPNLFGGFLLRDLGKIWKIWQGDFSDGLVRPPTIRCDSWFAPLRPWKLSEPSLHWKGKSSEKSTNWKGESFESTWRWVPNANVSKGETIWAFRTKNWSNHHMCWQPFFLTPKRWQKKKQRKR